MQKKLKLKSDNTERNLHNYLKTLISSDINDNNLQQIISKEAELSEFEGKKLFDILSKKQNYLLLEDERPTQQFLATESRKAGYHEITRLRVKKKQS